MVVVSQVSKGERPGAPRLEEVRRWQALKGMVPLCGSNGPAEAVPLLQGRSDAGLSDSWEPEVFFDFFWHD